jgi:hypothetical protein
MEALANPRIEHRNATENKRWAVGAVDASGVTTKPVDLGLVHTFTKVVAVKRGAASAGESLIIEQSHNGDADSPVWVSALAAALTGLVASPVSGAAMVVAAVPTARYVRAVHTNGATPQTVLVLELSAFEGI